jgi:protein-tyrosine phosphatase
MIDFHCHLLPSLDDGAVDIDDSIAMAKALADFGYKTVCCTPHCIKGYYDLTPQKVRDATLLLQADLDNAGINLELRPGTEYMLDECFSDFADDLLPLGDTRLVLCEAPQQAHPGVVQESLELIIEKGFVPLVAHPERTEYFYDILSQRVAGGASREKPEDQLDPAFEGSVSPRATRHTPLAFIKGLFAPRATRYAPRPFEAAQRPALPETCLFQANLGSFTGYYGPTVQRRAYELLKLGVYSALASDLHDSRSSSHVLVSDKFAYNPFLKKLSEFDGSEAALVKARDHSGHGGEQGELF